jgi:ankyrin repeat protein
MQQAKIGGRMLMVLLIGTIAATMLSCRSSLRADRSTKTAPQESPVPLQASAENKGQRCARKAYVNVGVDVDNNPHCYNLQRRLVTASNEGKLEDMRGALRDGANVDGSVEAFYFQPLTTAVYAGQLEAARLLLDNGATANIGSYVTGTPLTMAVMDRRVEFVKLLMARGADVCLKTDAGTAVEIAKEHGFTEILELLAEAQKNCK